MSSAPAEEFQASCLLSSSHLLKGLDTADQLDNGAAYMYNPQVLYIHNPLALMTKIKARLLFP